MPRRITTYLEWIVYSLYLLGCVGIVWGLFVFGCGDPVRTTVQPVRLRVVDATSGKPVVGAEVLLKSDFEAQHPLEQKEGESPLAAKQRHEYERQFWEQQPWFRGATDEDGRAEIVVKITALDRSRGATPPASRDWVTGKPHLVRVKKVEESEKRVWTKPGESPEEKLSLVMEPGAPANGRTVTVTVLEVDKPRYVNTR